MVTLYSHYILYPKSLKPFYEIAAPYSHATRISTLILDRCPIRRPSDIRECTVPSCVCDFSRCGVPAFGQQFAPSLSVLTRKPQLFQLHHAPLCDLASAAARHIYIYIYIYIYLLCVCVVCCSRAYTDRSFDPISLCTHTSSIRLIIFSKY